jgi:hypothetical protein
VNNPIPPNEWALIEPMLAGVRSMLELGNKKNERAGISYKSWFTHQYDLTHVSVDTNGEDGALALDLRLPLGELNGQQFDMVTNIGTSEHVDGQQCSVWENMWNHLAVGGALVSITPLPGDWDWHGMWYPTEDFYDALAHDNGMQVIELGVYGNPPRRCQYLVASKLRDGKFVYPGDELLFRNIIS